MYTPTPLLILIAAPAHLGETHASHLSITLDIVGWRLTWSDEGQSGYVHPVAQCGLRVVENRRIRSVKVGNCFVNGKAGVVVVVSQVAQLLHVAECVDEVPGMGREFLAVSLEFPAGCGVVKAAINP